MTSQSRAFFNHHESDVVRLRHALREILDGLQNRLLHRVTSRGGLPPNDLQQPLLAKHFFLRVLRVRETIGIHHQNVSFVEMKRAGLISGEIEHSQEKASGDQRFDFSRGRTEQIGRIMSRADELSRRHPGCRTKRNSVTN